MLSGKRTYRGSLAKGSNNMLAFDSARRELLKKSCSVVIFSKFDLVISQYTTSTRHIEDVASID